MLEKRWLQAAAVLALYMPAPLAAQSEELIVVTGSRNERGSYDNYYDEQQSAIGLTRKADNFLKPIYINSDSRNPEIVVLKSPPCCRKPSASLPKRGSRWSPGITGKCR